MDNTPIKFELNASDRNSEVWLKLTRHFNDRIQALRERNDSHGLSPEDTIKCRTEIAVLKSLLKL